jgi:class 3 adenylate cyclase
VTLPRRIPLVWILGIAFGGLVALAVGVTLALSLASAYRNTETLLRSRADAGVSMLSDRLMAHVEPAVSSLHGLADSIAAGRIELNDTKAVAGFAGAALAISPQLQRIVVLRADAQIQVIDRRGGDSGVDPMSLLQRANLPAALTARVAESVAWGRGTESLRWIPPEVSRRDGYSYVATQIPLRRQGVYLGVAMAIVTLDELSRFLSNMAETGRQTPFLIYGDTEIVAHPMRHAAQGAATGEARVDDPVLNMLWAEALKGQPPSPGATKLISRDSQSLVYKAIDAGTDHPWYVGLHYEGSLAAEEVARLRMMGIGGLAMLAASVLATVLMGRRLAQPLERLAAAAGRIERNDLEDFEPLGGSRIGEVDAASRAFNGMIEGLRDRQRIRDLFGRYVPKEVAERVLRDPKGISLTGEKREVSLLFSDLQGFTSLAETMPPEAVVTLLNAYFEEVCRIIIDHGGIIVDFIGDAVFAMFGAPENQPDHAARALAAAIDLDRFATRFAAAQRAAGVALGQTRIGVHTGVATVGNVGSRDRLKYSATGDVVNTSSRLEGANKNFGTRILASAETLRQAGAIPARSVGEIKLKGRAEALPVYEVFADGAPAWLEKYQSAYGQLTAGASSALSAFADLARETPEDGVVRFHYGRLQAGLTTSVVELTEK